MSGAGARQSSPGDKPKRSLSGQGGLLQRMFGSSNASKEALDLAPSGDASSGSEAPSSPALSKTESGNGSIDTIDENTEDESRDEVSAELRSPSRKGSTDDSLDKKRRTSGVGKLFSSAKQSLSNLGSSPDQKPASSGPQTPMQKLAKSDPALSVPQGSLNNSAGESMPGPRSTFRVGVTEDKNKKCRRTMEDTHAYLYNFLSTPSPFAAPEQPSVQKRYSLSLTQTLSRQSTRDSTFSEMANLSPKQSATKEVIETDNGYFAIFDGHAGTFAADWCGKKVHILLEEHIRRNPSTPIPEVLDMTFTTVDQQLEKLPLKNSGCTAVIAVLRWEDRIPNSQSATGSTAVAPAAAAAVAARSEDSSSQADGTLTPGLESKLKDASLRQRVLYTANVGDARIILCRNGKALRLSYDHKGSDENEGKRIAGAGGLILNNRVNGVLAVTRALGDAYMKDLVTGHPYTTETVIQPEIDEFLILACDGLWDVCTDQEAVDLVREVQDPQAASKMLVEHALARFSTDNLSCMVVRFHNQAVQQIMADDEHLLGVEGDFTTKLGDITEVEAILKDGENNAVRGGEANALARPTTEEMLEEVNKNQEPGPELNPAALEAARKDKPVSTAE